MPWRVTVQTTDGETRTLNLEGSRKRPPPFLVETLTDRETGKIEQVARPIIGIRWISKHNPLAQPSARSLRRKQRESYS